MNVCVIFDNLGPYHVARMAALSARCDLNVIELEEKSSEYAWLPAEEVPFNRITLETSVMPKEGRNTAIVETLENLAPDVVFIPGWSSAASLTALLWCLRAGKPALLMSESQQFDFTRWKWKERVKKTIVSAFNGALVGGTTHKRYVKDLGILERHVRMFYDVVDNLYFEKEARRAVSTDKRPDLPIDGPYFLCSARFIEKKNLPFLLRAYVQYRRAHCDVRHGEAWPLVILGDGPMRPLLVQIIAENELNAYVHLPGFKQYRELPSYYAFAGAFVLPSTSEQWGLVVNEAMASGLPILVSNRCGCAADLVVPGKTGFRFDPYDTQQLAKTMADVALAEPDELSRLGRAAQQHVRTFSPEEFAESSLQLAELAISSPSSRASPFLLALIHIVRMARR